MWFDQDVADEMHRALVTLQGAAGVGDEVIDSPAKVAVVIGGVRVIATAHQFEVAAINAAAVAVHDVANVLLIHEAGQTIWVEPAHAKTQSAPQPQP